MSKPRIAIDAMGGDHAPEETVAGAILAAQEDWADLILVGDESRVRPLLQGPGSENITVVHAPENVPMDMHASQALRIADKTSLGVAVNMVKEGQADAVFSAGNSGAFLAIALIKLRTIPGIARPAIATVWPVLNGPMVLLDSGANVDCRPEWLEQFGLMGSAYAKAVLKMENPRVATLSIGEEDTKGNAQVLEAAKLLRNAPVNYTGNIEGKDLFHNLADVVVVDGFVGNVVLKMGEGFVSDFMKVLKDAFLSGGVLAKVGALLSQNALRKMKRRFDYETYGGAPLLGLRGNCIYTHGRANRNAIKHAIHAAAVEVENDVVGKITELVKPHLAKEA
ncbi:MAG TPA: phosphate acyltransferase PlsX [Candidatus Baltobacteraceae bacterium]|nr:phosphate acyltransferase PlsX [Candidatus Baltobacteraceae bacterium]